MSVEAKAKKQEKQEAKQSEMLKKQIDTLNEDIKKLKSDADHWKNCYYKAYADTENLRKSIEKDHHEAMKYRAEGFVANLLNVLDGFHLALGAEAKSEELKNYLVGFTYIYNNLNKVLEDEGVKEISPKVNDKYDERTMEAMETTYSEGEPNRVLKVNLKGYMLKDHLVRPALVVVSTNKKETPKENADNQKEKSKENELNQNKEA